MDTAKGRQCLVVLNSLAVAFSTSSLAAAESSWHSRAWQANEGLPDDSVVGVAQTPDNFLWVATRGGLAKFEGVVFQEYPPLPDGMDARITESMLRDRSGRLWLARAGGVLLRIGPKGRRLFTTADGLQPWQVMVMAEDGEGAIWIAQAGGRLVRFLYSAPPPRCPSNRVNSRAYLRGNSDQPGHIPILSRARTCLRLRL